MTNKITIDGKEYTQRAISYIEIDGVKSDSTLIETNGPSVDGKMNVSLILKKEEEGNLNTKNTISEIKEKNNEKSNIEQKKLIEKKDNKSWIRRTIELIKQFLSK